MWLVMGGHEFDVAMTSNDFVILIDAVDLPPGDATLHVEVDGDDRTKTLHFDDGIRQDRRRQPHRSRGRHDPVFDVHADNLKFDAPPPRTAARPAPSGPPAPS